MSQFANPLKQFFRQPAIYLRLPSNGDFWPDGTVDIPHNRELPVYPMTALDEITYRTPDALFNGQAVITVIQSCVPNIRNAWAIPSTDLNSILIAIRIASYGHDMEIASTCPACNTESDYNVDLRNLLDQVKSSDFKKPIKYSDLEIQFCPMSYQDQTTVNLQNFEQQKQIQQIQESALPDQEKIAQLNKAIAQITKLTVDALKHSISSIRTPSTLVTEPEFIHEFLINCDRKLFMQIKEYIIDLRQSTEIPPMTIKCDSCQHEYQQLLNLDQTSFFTDAS
jgi:hypothetical protein